MTVIDVLGQPCPIPVVKAKQAAAELPPEGGALEVLVDNAVACENLKKFASGSGYRCTVEQQAPDRYSVVIQVGTGQARPVQPAAAPAPERAAPGGLVVAVGQKGMGQGSEELAAILVKGFVFSLSQLSPPPAAVLFFNSGVLLTTKDANTLEDIQELERLGTRVRICGTCVDYYGVKEQVAVGEITNMYGIVEEMAGASRVINL